MTFDMSGEAKPDFNSSKEETVNQFLGNCFWYLISTPEKFPTTKRSHEATFTSSKKQTFVEFLRLENLERFASQHAL